MGKDVKQVSFHTIRNTVTFPQKKNSLMSATAVSIAGIERQVNSPQSHLGLV